MRTILIVAMLWVLAPPAAASTRSEMVTSCRVFSRDSGTTRQRFTDTQLESFLNEAQGDLAQALRPIRKSHEFELVAGTTYYDLPDDYTHAYRVTRDRQVLKEESMKSLDKKTEWQSVGGLPSHYFVSFASRTKVGFYPFPDTVNSTGTIRLEYVAQVDEMTSDSSEPFNGIDEFQAYDDILVHFCAYMVAVIDGQTDVAGVHLSLYQQGFKAMQDEINQRPSYAPGITPAVR